MEVDERLARWVVLGVASGERMTTETVVRVLNDIFELDPVATARLFAIRVPCNEPFANHPTLPVKPEGDGFSVGFVGVLNGILWADDPCGSGVGVVTDEEELLGFRVVARPTDG